MRVDRAPESLPIGLIDIKFMNVILAIAESLKNTDVSWSIGGDVADEINGVELTPTVLEIYTSKDGAATIREALGKFKPTELRIVEHKLPRAATYDGKKYAVLTRSQYFEFKVDSVNVKVHGDLQFKIGDWEWGDPLEFTPELLYVVGKKITLVPAILRLDLYKGLGWTDKVNALTNSLSKAHG